jgi:hypothetical protein
METNRKLELTLCNLLPYGLKGMRKDGGDALYTLSAVYDKGSFTWRPDDFGDSTMMPMLLLLHSMGKLIDNVLDDENDYFYQLNLELCDILNSPSCEHFVKAFIDKKYYALDINIMIEVAEWLKANHFNIFNLPKEQYLEKSEQ